MGDRREQFIKDLWAWLNYLDSLLPVGNHEARRSLEKMREIVRLLEREVSR